MGYTTYSVVDRSTRAMFKGFNTKSVDEIFTQQKIKRIHEDMDPKGVVSREARDSNAHPNTVPIQLYLDVTGSMGHIPHQLIKEGLPTLIGTLIQKGIPDVALMFGAIGDHECDKYPLQVAQFESGDKELDMWLTRTYLEGGGGGNDGESYALAWYFAANHVEADSYAKGKKGFVFTIGDEPFLENYPLNALKSIVGDTCKAEGLVTAETLLEQATKNNHVYHISLEHGYRMTSRAWKKLLGDHLIVVSDYTAIPNMISEIIFNKLTTKDKYNTVLVKEEIL